MAHMLVTHAREFITVAEVPLIIRTFGRDLDFFTDILLFHLEPRQKVEDLFQTSKS